MRMQTLTWLTVAMFAISAAAATGRVGSQLAVASIAPEAATEIQLSPARPLSPALPLVPAAGYQDLPDIAWNGRDFLAIWLGPDGARATRVSADGEPANPLGTPLGIPATLIASNGDGYVAAASYGLQRLDNDGAPIGPPVVLSEPFAIPVHLVTNGSTYLLLTQEFLSVSLPSPWVPSIWRTTLFNGNLEKILELEQTTVDIAGAGVHDHDYYIVQASTDAAHTLAVNVLSDSGNMQTIPLPATDFAANDTYTGASSAAFSANEILVASNAFHAAWYAVFGYDGVLKKEATVPYGQTAARSDGHQFALFFAGEDRQQDFMIRLNPDGSLRDQSPIHVRSADLRIASNGARSVAVWADSNFSAGTDIAARGLNSFDDLVADPDVATLVSYSGPDAERPQLASAGLHLLGVWLDRTTATLRGSLDQKQLTVATAFQGATPVIAVGNRSFLVTWYDAERETVFARRITFDGGVSAPIAVAMHLPSGKMAGPPAVTFDGSRYLVMWTQDGILGLHVTEDGDLIEPILTADPQNDFAKSLRLLTASGPFLAYSVYVYIQCQPWEQCAGSSLLKATPLVSLSSITPDGAFEGLSAEGSFEAAVTGDRITFGWDSGSFGQTRFDGSPIAPARRKSITTNPDGCDQRRASNPKILWDGAAIVLAWTERKECQPAFASYTVRAIRVTKNLDPIDDAPFDISGHDATPDPPSMTNTPGGVAIAYSAYDAASGGAPRVLVRTLARTGAPVPRRRSSRP